MENFKEFRERIYSFEKDSLNLNNFKTNPNLKQKFNNDGSIKPFFGDTVIFEIDKYVKDCIDGIRNTLYSSCSQIFSTKLYKDTFHLTLHDLTNSNDLSSIKSQMDKNKIEVEELINQIKTNNTYSIQIKKSYIFNLVNTSIVIGFEPKSEKDYNLLFNLYEIFQNVVNLNYNFTPHITIAYYKPDINNILQLTELNEVLTQLNQIDIEIDLKLDNIFYTRFDSMNNYYIF